MIQIYLIMLVMILAYFRDYIGPLIISTILFYLFLPISNKISKLTRLRWQISVILVFVIFSIVLTSLIAMAGFLLVQQMQNWLIFARDAITNLPETLHILTTETYTFGPFQLSLQGFDISTIVEQLLVAITFTLNGIGVGFQGLFTRFLTTVGWIFFIYQISFVLLSGITRDSSKLIHLQIPGYEGDVNRLGQEFRMIWRNYFRFQLIMFLTMTTLYSIAFLFLGLRNALFLAVIVGLSRFIPYFGRPFAWILTISSIVFQGTGNFGLEGFYLVISVFILLVVFLLLERSLGSELYDQPRRIHPVVELLAVIIVTRIIGVIGLILATPVAATIILISRYSLYKVFDVDPWIGEVNIVRTDMETGDKGFASSLFFKAQSVSNKVNHRIHQMLDRSN